MKKTTIEYQKSLLSRSNFSAEEFTTKPIHMEINERMILQKLNKKELCQRINIDSTIGYKYLNNTRKIPRNIALAFMIDLKFDYSEVQRLLKENGYPIIYEKLPFDQVLYYSLMNEYSLLQTNELLAEKGHTKLT